MVIKVVKPLMLKAVKVITFSRYPDHRGFFSEHYRRSEFRTHPLLEFMGGKDFVQANTAFSRKGTLRGLHFQWDPMMGKLVRTLYGRMVDLVMDVRKGSPTFGCCIAYDMYTDPDDDEQQWIWVPPGFAHGNYFTENSMIEYLCTGEYNPDGESGISPLSSDIDWSLCDADLLLELGKVIESDSLLISDKDREAQSVLKWLQDKRSENFCFGKLNKHG